MKKKIVFTTCKDRNISIFWVTLFLHNNVCFTRSQKIPISLQLIKINIVVKEMLIFKL